MLALCGHHGLPGLRALSTEVFLTRSRLGTEKEEEYDGGGGAKKFLNSVCLALSADPRARYQFLPPLTRQEEAVKFAEKVRKKRRALVRGMPGFFFMEFFLITLSPPS